MSENGTPRRRRRVIIEEGINGQLHESKAIVEKDLSVENTLGSDAESKFGLSEAEISMIWFDMDVQKYIQQIPKK